MHMAYNPGYARFGNADDLFMTSRDGTRGLNKNSADNLLQRMQQESSLEGFE